MYNINKIIIILCLLLLFYIHIKYLFFGYFELFGNYSSENVYQIQNINQLSIYYKCKKENINNLYLANIAYDQNFDSQINNKSMIDYDENYKNDFSLSLLSVNDFITLPPIILTNNGLTIAFYMMIKPSDKKTNYVNVFDFGNAPNDDNITLKLFENNVDNHFTVFYDRVEYKSEFILCDFQPNQWFHFAVVLYKNHWILYFNGQPIPINIVKFIYPRTHIRVYNYIGKNNSEDYSFGGYIDEFKLYNSSLSQNDIKNIM